jgi:hypothetical protein
MIDDGYRQLVVGIKGRIPEYNSRFDTLDSVIAFLTKDVFIDWRYAFELIEAEILPENRLT